MYPHERSLVSELSAKPFVLLGVNSDDSKAKLKQAAKDNQITWRSWWDRNTSGVISTLWSVAGWPTLVILDHKGVIRARYEGNPGAVLDETIHRLVAEAEQDQSSK